MAKSTMDMPVNKVHCVFWLCQVVSNYSAVHSHWASMRSLGGWLFDHNVPGICGVDTRAITKVRVPRAQSPRCVCHLLALKPAKYVLIGWCVCV